MIIIIIIMMFMFLAEIDSRMSLATRMPYSAANTKWSSGEMLMSLPFSILPSSTYLYVIFRLSFTYFFYLPPTFFVPPIHFSLTFPLIFCLFSPNFLLFYAYLPFFLLLFSSPFPVHSWLLGFEASTHFRCLRNFYS